MSVGVGVEVTVEDDVATVAFPDVSQRGVGVRALLAAAGDPGKVRKVTRPRPGYVVPVDVAERAFAVRFGPEASEPADEGEPSLEWSRSQLNEYAAALGVEDPASLPKKQAVLDAITKAKAEDVTPEALQGDDNTGAVS